MEVFRDVAGDAASRCGLRVAAYLEEQFSRGVLADLDIELLYVPIIMPTDMHDTYTERSRVRLKARRYECSPHLDYLIFISEDRASQMREFVRGLSTSLPHLHRLGASPEQLSAIHSDFEHAATLRPA